MPVSEPLKKRASAICRALAGAYPDAGISLDHKNPFQLLVATILSAQCTDERVNKVTPQLFASYPTPQAMSSAPLPELEKLIRSTGFYRNKALSILESSKAIVSRFGGQVPRTMEALLSLRGVARKTANVVLGNAYGINAGIVVDTHVKRLAFRMGLTKNTDPEKVEKDLMPLIPQAKWAWFSHALISHGRACCMARNPQCRSCPVMKLCPRRGVCAE